jgi:Protein of unknown function (DUF3455)
MTTTTTKDARGRRPSRLSRVAFACASVMALFGLATATALGQPAPQSAPGDPLDPRTYAPNSKPFLAVHATGVQKYTCQANGAWLFTDPEASLYAPASARKPLGTHFLNFATGRPVWRLKDGSSVEAARKASAPGGAGNIPLLLLEAATASVGPDGDRLAETTWVQRLNTAGGIAPVGACTPGAAAAVPYTTDYVFWRATREDGD